MRRLLERYTAPQGYRAVLAVGLPLIVSMSAATVTQFTDRVFLAHYSLDAIAASMPGGIANFLFTSFFMGLLSYVNVFVAQYTGANQNHRVGAALWQGLRLAALAGLFLVGLAFLAGPLFRLAGHAPAVQALERDYYFILCLGSGLFLAGVVLSAFFSGRGLTRPVMLANMAGAALNIPLDWLLIFGKGPIPALGVKGAAWATVASWGLTTAILAVLVFTRKHEAAYQTRSARALDPDLMRRLVRFGSHSGIQFFVDLFGFTFFMFLVGRLGVAELAAVNIVFSLNHFAFLPMMGLHVAVESLVGQSIGRATPGEGARATESAMHLCLAYMALIGLGFVAAGGPLMDLFRPAGLEGAQYAAIRHTGVVLLWYVAFYSLSDALALVYLGGLKGAGDTRFVMAISAACSLGFLVASTWLALEVLHLGLHAAFALVAAHVLILAFAARRRFQRGKWQKMKVIEE